MCLLVLRWTVLIFATFSQSVAAQQITVRGQVVDSVGRPVSRAQIRLYTNTTPLLRSARPVRNDGTFEVLLPGSFSGTHVRCEVAAPGYEPVRETAPVLGSPNISCGRILLRRLPGLRLGSVVVSESADRRFARIDVEIHNAGSRRHEVVGVRLLGTARRQTECLDLSPGVTYTIFNGGNLNVVRVEDHALNRADSVRITGAVDFLPCDQIRLDVTIPTSFSMNAGESLKVRFQLPQRLRQRPDAPFRRYNLQAWEQIQIRLLLPDGSYIEG